MHSLQYKQIKKKNSQKFTYIVFICAKMAIVGLPSEATIHTSNSQFRSPISIQRV